MYVFYARMSSKNKNPSRLNFILDSIQNINKKFNFDSDRSKLHTNRTSEHSPILELLLKRRSIGLYLTKHKQKHVFTLNNVISTVSAL
jgi:hypothetical protein